MSEKLINLLVALGAVTSLGLINSSIFEIRRVESTDTVVNVGSTAANMQVTDDWRRLIIRDKVVLMIPQDMRSVEPFGDSERYREAYSNKDFSLTIVYDLVSPKSVDESQKVRLYSCERTHTAPEDTTYQESVVEIDGKKAMLRIAHASRVKSITADLCFPATADVTIPLRIFAICNDDRALETVQRVFHSITFNK